MFNVYPVTIRYTRTPHAGVLKGTPLRCSFGVESRLAGVEKYGELVATHLMDNFTDFEIVQK